MGLTTSLTIWAATGPLVGIVVGHVLSRRWQHQQWKLESRRQEYRELLQSLTNAYLQMLRFIVEGVEKSKESDAINVDGLTEHVYRIEQAKMESFRVLQDRIVIADELESVDALGKWAEAFHNFEMDGNERRFAEQFKKLRETLVGMARREGPRKIPFHKRLSRWAEYKVYRWKNRRPQRLTGG